MCGTFPKLEFASASAQTDSKYFLFQTFHDRCLLWNMSDLLLMYCMLMQIPFDWFNDWIWRTHLNSTNTFNLANAILKHWYPFYTNSLLCWSPDYQSVPFQWRKSNQNLLKSSWVSQYTLLPIPININNLLILHTF